MVTLIAGSHQCLVAEIVFGDDPTSKGDTPFTSDNLAQRNLATVPVANPGLEAITRTAQTSFEVKPSDAPTNLLLATPGTGPAATVSTRIRADELLFWRNDLPAATVVEVFLPDVDIDEVLSLGARWLGPAVLKRVDSHTLRFELGKVTYLPLPGSRTTPIVGLLSVTLPPGIVKGQRYTLSVQQYSGRTRRFVGAFDFAIPVGDAASILPGEIRKLSLLKYVFQAMPAKDRWYPVFERYLYEIGERVRGFGADPDSVGPSPHGTGEEEPGGGPRPKPGDDGADHGGLTCATGKICDVHYDCFGEFQCFTLVDCDGACTVYCASKRLEKVVLMAWREGTTATVYARPGSRAAAAGGGKPVATRPPAGGHDSHHAPARSQARDRVVPAAGAAPANTTCPWDGRPVVRDAVVRIRDGAVGFCSAAHRDHFEHAVKYFRECVNSPLTPESHHPAAPPHHSINRQCPWTGKPVHRSAVTQFEGHAVGFATERLRDEFQEAVDIAAGGGQQHGQHEHEHDASSCPLCGTVHGGAPEHRAAACAEVVRIVLRC
jgi:hypothetical protein